MASQENASREPASISSLGAWLRQLREEKGLAQREVAAAADMDSSHYGKVETGKRLLTDEQSVAVATKLGVPVAEMRVRLVAARWLQACDGDVALAHDAAGMVQESAAAYFVDNPVNKRAKKK